MSKQDNKLAVWVLATLTSGIGLIYTLIMYHNIFFAVIGMSALFLICAFILTQSIISFATMRNKSLNVQIKNSVDGIANQIEAMSGVQSQIGKATYLYTRKAAQSVATLENNYSESQEALYKNLISLSNAHNKATKLMIKYDQSNTTKVISTIKDLRNQLSDTMVQGFDQLQPDNSDIVNTLGDIVEYLKSQSGNMDQEMGVQLNSIARELQNVSNSIQHIQFASNIQPMGNMPNAFAPETMQAAPAEDMVTEPAADELTEATEKAIAEPTAETMEEPITEAAADEDEPSESFTADTENSDIAETAEAFTPTFTVVGKSDGQETAEDNANAADFIAEDTEEPAETTVPDTTAIEEPAETTIPDTAAIEEPAETTVPNTAAEKEPVEESTPFKTIGDLGDDPNKQLSPDEIAALFAAAEPAPKKEPKAETAPEPVVTPISDDPNKQLTPEEIAALFAAAEPAPKKEPVNIQPISNDPNKQLTPEEIAALFAASN